MSAHSDGGDPIAFAGIWEAWKSPDGGRLQTLATITTEANGLLAGIQDTVPSSSSGPTGRTGWARRMASSKVARAAPDDVLRTRQVDKKVGNVRNYGPELIKPVAELEPTLLSPIWSAQARE